ncbi:MAG: hypothetical protein ABSC61_09165 [Anaerolineales bacterium]
MSTDNILYLYVVLGVLVSVTLPIIRQYLPKPTIKALTNVSLWGRIKETLSGLWEKARPYIVTAVFSLIVALVIFAFLGDSIKTWQSAFLAGYTADSTLQKITTN